ncbi:MULTISPECIES: hypothetical protein [unclassified Kitasatospora]|uniref:hypothetical protein n=1 Tax=unclassified Kitasatospora TaxID=2633591 RepID=UPI0037F7E949
MTGQHPSGHQPEHGPDRESTREPERGQAAPMTVADYWRGDFTLRAEAVEDRIEPSLSRLGPSGITVRGRDLATLLAPAYDAFRA